MLPARWRFVGDAEDPQQFAFRDEVALAQPQHRTWELTATDHPVGQRSADTQRAGGGLHIDGER
jgi:hypothetical protein